MFFEKYIVKISAARMPAKCWGRYKNVAVIERASLSLPVRAIDIRHRSVADIRYYSGPHYAGTTDRCAAARATSLAMKIARRLQAEYEDLCAEAFVSAMSPVSLENQRDK